MKPRIVYVNWRDAIHPTDTWEYTADFERDSDGTTETVGWLVNRSRATVQVAVTCSGRGTESEQYTGIMTIPVGCIETIITIPHDGTEGKVLYTRKKPKRGIPRAVEQAAEIGN